MELQDQARDQLAFKTQNTIAQLGSDRIITFFNDEGGKFAAGGVFASGRVYIFYTN